MGHTRSVGASCLPYPWFRFEFLGKSSSPEFRLNERPDSIRGTAIYVSLPHRMRCKDDRFPFEVKIAWDNRKRLAKANTYESRVIVHPCQPSRADAHCSMKWSSHPGVDPKSSNSALDISEVPEPDAIESIEVGKSLKSVCCVDRHLRS